MKMKIESANVKITLSIGEIEVLNHAREILGIVSDQIEQASANHASCIVTTENHCKLDNEEIENAECALGSLLCLT